VQRARPVREPHAHSHHAKSEQRREQQIAWLQQRRVAERFVENQAWQQHVHANAHQAFVRLFGEPIEPAHDHAQGHDAKHRKHRIENGGGLAHCW
jgi:hypothetical protein